VTYSATHLPSATTPASVGGRDAGRVIGFNPSKVSKSSKASTCIRLVSVSKFEFRVNPTV